jgi:hypothetical protein
MFNLGTILFILAFQEIAFDKAIYEDPHYHYFYL